MKIVNTLTLLVFSMAVVLSPVMAQDDEITIDVVTDVDSLPEEVTREIELPKQAAEPARDHAATGLDKANSARERGREFGETRSAEARERSRERGRDNSPETPGRP